MTALEELRPPDSRVPELKLDDKEHVSPEREAPETQAPTTDSTKDTNPRHGILYRAWTGTMKGVERLVGFDKRPELPIWFETISTPPTFTAQDIRHGAVFGSGMEMIEQVSVGIADLLKGLGGGIAASWISVPLELTWSWFWEGPEGVKKNLDGCGHDHSHDHHHEHHHDHGGGNHDHHHSHESEHEPKKKGVRGFFKEFGEKWQARSEELSRSTGALGSGMVRGGKGFLHAVTHPIETTKFIYSLGTSHEARQEHIAPALRSFNEGFARAMGIITPVLGHKLFDGTGIILGHLAFASIGLPTWIGAMVGNVLFSMPYHILSASLKNRFREIATTREMRRKVKEAEDQFQKMNGSFDRLLG